LCIRFGCLRDRVRLRGRCGPVPFRSRGFDRCKYFGSRRSATAVAFADCI
jgi:hypothetical protein